MSEKQDGDLKPIKNAIIGVVILLVIATLAPTLISEIMGVDFDTLCQTVNGTTTCVGDKSSEVAQIIGDGLGYVSIAIALVAFIWLIIAAVKY